MEQKNMENIDINKHKELFAYEMTEVILKLKGEFAVISGKDTPYWEKRVAPEELKVAPVAMPQTPPEKLQQELPRLPTYSPALIPEAPLLRRPFAIAQVQTFKPITLTPAQLAPKVPPVPSVTKPQLRNIQSSEAEKPAILLDIPEAVLPGVYQPPVLDALHDIDVPDAALPGAYQPPVLDALHGVDIPDAALPGAYQPPVLDTLHGVDVPDAALPGVYQPPVLDALHGVDIPDAALPGAYQPPVLDALHGVDIPDAELPGAYQPPVLDALHGVDIPDAALPGAYQPPVLDTLHGVDIPDAALPGAYQPPVLDALHGVDIPGAPIPQLPNSGGFRSIQVTDPALELPQSDLSAFRASIQDTARSCPAAPEAAQQAAQQMQTLLQEAHKQFTAAHTQQLSFTADCSAQEILTKAMEIDISFVSAEDYFKDFQLV